MRDLTTHRNHNRRNADKVNSVSLRHRVVYEKRIRKLRADLASDTRYIPVTRQTSIRGWDDDDTRMRLIAKRVRMYVPSIKPQQQSVLAPR